MNLSCPFIQFWFLKKFFLVQQQNWLHTTENLNKQLKSKVEVCKRSQQTVNIELIWRLHSHQEPKIFMSFSSTSLVDSVLKANSGPKMAVQTSAIFQAEKKEEGDNVIALLSKLASFKVISQKFTCNFHSHLTGHPQPQERLDNVTFSVDILKSITKLEFCQ